MPEKSNKDGDLKDEFLNFSENLKDAFNTAWESNRRVEMQKNIESGLINFGQALNDFLENFDVKEKSQKLVSEIEDLGEKLHAGEIEEKAKDALLSAIKNINAQLEKVSEHITETDSEG